MTDHKFKESITRLERLGNAGRFDAIKAGLAKGAPVLAEMGVTADQARAALETAPNKLESMLDMKPPMLEAIVRAVGRPPLLVKNDKVEGKLSLTGDFAPGTDAKIAAVEAYLPSIGRIEFVNHDMAWGGTGWVIAEDGPDHLLVITNRHVAKLVAKRTYRGDGVYMFSPYANARYGANIDFVEEADSAGDPARVLPLEKFVYLADDAAADVAIARVKKPGGGLAIAPLDLADSDGGDQEMVAVVGYPAADPYRNDPTEMQNYFRDLFDVKRFSPGFMRAQPGMAVLSHDCTTLGGNSGSPVLSLDRAAVVGLHFAGQYGVGNSAVRVSTLKALLDAQSNGVVVTPAVIEAAEEASDGRHQPDFFDGRAGYDPEFLQVVPVPLPVLPAALQLATPSDARAERPHELRYQNFGILYSEAMMSPAIAALNIDGSRTHAIKRNNSRWYKDLRIAPELQLGQAEYGDPDIDRGHMVRRAATNWGDDIEQAKRADFDSFHYTVSALQHKGLNRNRQTWLGLEDYIMNSTRTHGFRATVFSGPVFRDDDPPLGTTGAPIPMDFFKVVSMIAEDDTGILRLHSTAYVLTQGQLIQQMLADRGQVEAVEGFAFGAFKTFQVRIADLEALTGYDFGPLRDADPLAVVTEGLEAARGAVVVDDLASIVL